MRFVVRAVVALAALTGPLASVARAQAYEGVLMTTDKNPVVDARVFLMTPRGYAVDTARTNLHGEFRVAATGAGKYALTIRRLGFVPEQSRFFTLDTDQTMRDTLVINFTKLLRSVEVVVREQVKRLVGIDVKQLGRRFITPEQIDSTRVSAKGLADFIHRAQVPGVWIEREGLENMCFKTQMQSGCAQVYLDGLPVESNLEISPMDIESIILLRPNEGFTVTGDPGGSVFVYTRKTISRANR